MLPAGWKSIRRVWKLELAIQTERRSPNWMKNNLSVAWPVFPRQKQIQLWIPKRRGIESRRICQLKSFVFVRTLKHQIRDQICLERNPFVHSLRQKVPLTALAVSASHERHLTLRNENTKLKTWLKTLENPKTFLSKELFHYTSNSTALFHRIETQQSGLRTRRKIFLRIPPEINPHFCHTLR